jgi:NADH:ubiquinone oxidoreductase subunit 4 (subunit M)
MNAGLLLDDAPVTTLAEDLVGGEAEDPDSIVKVPVTVVVVVAVCLAVTIVFGIIPAPIVDFAHKATLLFLP